MITWLQELDLSYSGAPVKMGLRKLGNRSWLLSDNRRNVELALKNELTKNESKEVFVSLSGAESAGEFVASLIEKHGIVLNDKACHPLERAGLSVQEDLCLIQKTSEGWVLKAASLCFPSRWRLADKIGKSMAVVHGPVDGYQEHLEKKVTAFFDRIGPDPVWRRNWFIHPDDSLYQPAPPEGGDPIIPSDGIGERLFVRSERQTLRALELPGWILFTIRVQQTQLKNLIEGRGEEFSKWVREAPESHHRQKGLQPEQVNEILKALD